MTSELETFGNNVRKARLERGWSLEVLAHEALGNQERKSYVSRVETGKQKVSAATVLKFAKALDLPQALVNRVSGFAEDTDDQPSQTETDADRLLAELEELRQTFKLSEALAVALAYEYAESNPTDLMTALRELRSAFEVAAKRSPPTNLSAEINAIMAEVDRLNDAGALDQAGARIKAALAEQRDRAAEVQQGIGALLDKGIAQAVLERSVPDAVQFLLEKLAQEVPDPAAWFGALRAVWHEWYERGRDKGLGFDLEVAIALAEAARDRAGDADQRGAALNDLGTALATLGERASDTARLEQAVTAYEAALLEYTRDRMPLNWAGTQNNLGNALLTLGERASDIARLEQAVTAYEAALLEYTCDRMPLNWATTQNNLGNALLTLGERASDTARLEQAVTAFEAALLEYTRAQVPLNWAGTQNNLGNALLTLGERASDTARLEQAVTAFEAALLELTRERVPLNWANAHFNMALAEQALAEKSDSANAADHLRRALAHVEAALEVFDPISSAYFHTKAITLRDHIRAAMGE